MLPFGALPGVGRSVRTTPSSEGSLVGCSTIRTSKPASSELRPCRLLV